MDADRAGELLRRERERIEKALAELAGSNNGELASQDQHLADQGSELYNDEFEAGQRERLLADLAALERAEARLAAGTTAFRVESGEPIPDERLEAVPTAERTAEEQARFEARPLSTSEQGSQRRRRTPASMSTPEPRAAVASSARSERLRLAACALLLSSVRQPRGRLDARRGRGWVWLVLSTRAPARLRLRARRPARVDVGCCSSSSTGNLGGLGCSSPRSSPRRATSSRAGSCSSAAPSCGSRT